MRPYEVKLESVFETCKMSDISNMHGIQQVQYNHVYTCLSTADPQVIVTEFV